MDMAKLEDLRNQVRDWKTIGHSAKFPLPIVVLEQLIAAAMRGNVGKSFRNAIDGSR